jgi:FtsP/CotA-like multicopper oxidase with cupredoxin domain
VYNNETSSSFTNTSNLITLPNPNEWVYVVITEAFIPVTHPIHLHGHDFFVLASGIGSYDPSTVVLKLDNPPRRDVALLPSQGYLVIAFQTDNPGAWLMHCHIGWHTIEGFALQFLERETEIWSNNIIDSTALTNTCNTWSSYASTQAFVQVDDSGI